MHIPDFTLGSELTEEQCAFFDEHGFIRFRGVATREEVDHLIGALHELEEAFITEGRESVLGIPLKFGTTEEGAPFINRFAFTSHYSPAFRDFVQDVRFEPVRLLCGSQARLAEEEKDGVVVNHFVNHEGSRYKQLGWHTDGLRDLFFLTMPEPMLNVGLYLDDCPASNGGVRLLPGTHKQSMFSMMFRKPYFLYHKPDPQEICLEARAGDLTIHDGRLWHRTARSTRSGADSRRRTIYMAYIDGPKRIRTEQSPPLLYHRFHKLVG